MDKVLKVKEWLTREKPQYDVLSTKLIHLFKLNRFMTLGASYPHLSHTIIFTKAHDDRVRLDWKVINDDWHTVTSGTSKADNLCYDAKHGYF